MTCMCLIMRSTTYLPSPPQPLHDQFCCGTLKYQRLILSHDLCVYSGIHTFIYCVIKSLETKSKLLQHLVQIPSAFRGKHQRFLSWMQMSFILFTDKQNLSLPWIDWVFSLKLPVVYPHGLQMSMPMLPSIPTSYPLWCQTLPGNWRCTWWLLSNGV